LTFSLLPYDGGWCTHHHMLNVPVPLGALFGKFPWRETSGFSRIVQFITDPGCFAHNPIPYSSNKCLPETGSALPKTGHATSRYSAANVSRQLRNQLFVYRYQDLGSMLTLAGHRTPVSQGRARPIQYCHKTSIRLIISSMEACCAIRLPCRTSWLGTGKSLSILSFYSDTANRSQEAVCMPQF
jgi:hypothetical protein